MKRGGLIFPVMAEILPFVGAQIDEDFREPLRPGGTDLYGKPYFVACQVESSTAEAIAMQPNGNDPSCRLCLVLNHPLRSSEPPAPKPRDRLVALRSLQGALLQDFSAYDGLYANEVAPLSFGLFRGRSKVNLLRVSFHSRSYALRRAG